MRRVAMARTPRALVIGLACALLMTACGDDGETSGGDGGGDASAGDEREYSTEELTVKFNIANAITYTPLMVAVENGYFEDEGLTIEPFNVGEAGMDNAQAVLAGALDAGGVSGHTVLQALAQGSDARAVSIFAGGADPLQIIVSSDSDVTSASDFAGLRIGYEQGGLLQQMVYTLLDAEGIEQSEVELIPIPAAEMPAAFESDVVDAVVVYEPFASAIVDNGTGNVIGNMSEYVEEVPRYILMGAQFMEEKAEAAKRFLRAMHRGMQFVRTSDPADVAPIVAEYIEATEESLTTQISQYTFNPIINDSVVEILQSDLEFLIELDRIEDPDVEPADAFDLSIQEELLEENPELYED